MVHHWCGVMQAKCSRDCVELALFAGRKPGGPEATNGSRAPATRRASGTPAVHKTPPHNRAVPAVLHIYSLRVPVERAVGAPPTNGRRARAVVGC